MSTVEKKKCKSCPCLEIGFDVDQDTGKSITIATCYAEGSCKIEANKTRTTYEKIKAYSDLSHRILGS